MKPIYAILDQPNTLHNMLLEAATKISTLFSLKQPVEQQQPHERMGAVNHSRHYHPDCRSADLPVATVTTDVTQSMPCVMQEVWIQGCQGRGQCPREASPEQEHSPHVHRAQQAPPTAGQVIPDACRYEADPCPHLTALLRNTALVECLSMHV